MKQSRNLRRIFEDINALQSYYIFQLGGLKIKKKLFCIFFVLFLLLYCQDKLLLDLSESQIKIDPLFILITCNRKLHQILSERRSWHISLHYMKITFFTYLHVQVHSKSSGLQSSPWKKFLTKPFSNRQWVVGKWMNMKCFTLRLYKPLART